MRIVYPGGSAIKEGAAASKIVLERAGKNGNLYSGTKQDQISPKNNTVKHSPNKNNFINIIFHSDHVQFRSLKTLVLGGSHGQSSQQQGSHGAWQGQYSSSSICFCGGARVMEHIHN